MYNDTGQFDQAIKDYTEAIHLDPADANTYYNRSGAYYLTGRFQPALDDARRAKALGFNVDPRYIETLENEVGKIMAAP